MWGQNILLHEKFFSITSLFTFTTFYGSVFSGFAVPWKLFPIFPPWKLPMQSPEIFWQVSGLKGIPSVWPFHILAPFPPCNCLLALVGVPIFLILNSICSVDRIYSWSCTTSTSTRWRKDHSFRTSLGSLGP